MAAVNTRECVSPKMVLVESGKNGNCHCANATCTHESSDWLDMYVQTPPPALPKRDPSKKRGIGLDSAKLGNAESSLDGYYSCDDMDALNLADSWFYNWGALPDTITSFRPGKCFGVPRAAEFVPMVWGCSKKGCSFPPNYQYIWEQAGVSHVLGFNEPDHVDQSNMTANEAAHNWVSMQMMAAGFSPAMKLVSPAPATYNGDGVSTWLDEFFGNCSDVVPECDPTTVAAIAMHDYDGDAEALVKKAEGAAKRYGRKVWITEFADGPWHRTPEGDTRASNDAYMKKVLPLLDASDSVERYAWFASRSDPGFNIVSNLLPYDKGTSVKLTSSGKIYAGQTGVKPDPEPTPPTDKWHKVAARTACQDLFWLGGAEWPPAGHMDMSLDVCKAAAESESNCTHPKTIAYEHGGNGGCMCSSATCVQVPSEYQDLWAQGAHREAVV